MSIFGSILGAVAGPLIGGLFGGDDGGSSPPAQQTQPMAFAPGIPFNLLQALAGGANLANLFGSGPDSLEGMTQTSAAAADPFAPVRQNILGYIPQAAADFKMVTNTAQPSFMGAVGGAAPYAMAPAADPRLAAITGTASLTPALQALTENDPSTQFRYQTGLDALSRGAAAGGYASSGRQMVELEKYGQDFASTEFQNKFARQAELQRLSQGVQGQNFNQLLQAGQLGGNLYQQQFERLLGGATFGQGQAETDITQQGELLKTLLWGGMQGSSPPAAANILAGRFGNKQTVLADLLANLQGGAAGNLPNTVSNLLKGLGRADLPEFGAPFDAFPMPEGSTYQDTGYGTYTTGSGYSPSGYFTDTEDSNFWNGDYVPPSGYEYGGGF